MSKRIGDIEQAAQEVGMSVSWIRQNMRILPHYKVGRRVLFDLDELTEALMRYRREPKSEPVTVPA